MAVVSSFEVTAQPIAPVPNVPYYIQGTFLQITNLDPQQATVTVMYNPASPGFVAASGPVSLTADYIDAAGALNFEPNFIANGNKFSPRAIQSGGTMIFGVQYIIGPPNAAVAWMPQKRDSETKAFPAVLAAALTTSVSARGLITVTADRNIQLFCTATIRQLFLTFDAAGKLVDTNPGSYSLPIQGGPQLNVGP